MGVKEDLQKQIQALQKQLEDIECADKHEHEFFTNAHGERVRDERLGYWGIKCDLSFTKTKRKTKLIPEWAVAVARTDRGEWFAYNTVPDFKTLDDFRLNNYEGKRRCYQEQTEKELYDIVTYLVI